MEGARPERRHGSCLLIFMALPLDEPTVPPRSISFCVPSESVHVSQRVITICAWEDERSGFKYAKRRMVLVKIC